MQTGLDTVGDHSRAIAEGGGRCRALDPDGKQKPHAIGASEVEILADECLEEVPSLYRAVEHVGETYLKLRDGETMIVAGRAIRDGRWPGQPLRPAIEEGLHVGRAQRVACSLEGRGIRAGQESIVEARAPDALPAQALLHPLVPIETQLDGIRDVRAD